jgi:hypothetical protein
VENANNYLLFEGIDKLTDFLNDARNIKLTMYQVVPTNEKQKLVLGYYGNLGDEYIKKLTKYVLECFKMEPVILQDRDKKRSSIVLDLILEKYSDNGNYFKKLYNCVVKNDPDLADRLRIYSILVDPVTDDEYILHRLTEVDSSGELIKKLATIHVIGNIITKPKYSQKAINWIKSIEVEHNIKIQHAENGGEYHIPGTRWKADGYCEELHTIYEYHGDYWHGNPKNITRMILIKSPVKHSEQCIKQQ